MIFDLLTIKYTAMKKLFFIILTLLVVSSCATTNQSRITRIENRKDKKLAAQADVKKAVESKRYIIKLERLYFSHGGMADLMPDANYMIVDGEKAIISAAYLGRQFDFKPIAGINIRGISSKYEVTNDLSKGMYKIQMDVSNKGTDSFDVYLTIGKNGFCTVTFSALKIDHVRYSGHLIPIRKKTAAPQQDTNIV